MLQTRVVIDLLESRLLLAANWTVLVYIDADNNLEGAAIANIEQMEAVGSDANVNIVAQIDRTPGYDSSNGNWTDTRRGLITKGHSASTIESTLTSIGEADMGSPSTLTNFIQWGAATYPADHYALVLWDHGGGTSGICWDDTSNSNLSITELGSALAGAGTPFDLIGFDACLMSMMEVGYQIRNYADVMVASEQTVPWDGWPYAPVLTALEAAPTQSASDFASSIVTQYGQYYHNAETMSAITLGAGISNLATQLDNFAGAVISQHADWAALSTARNGSSYFTDTDFRDLGTFLGGVASSATNATILSAAQSAQTAYAADIISNHSGPGEGATGLSIYLPAQGQNVDSSYTSANFSLLSDTRWDEFLSAFTGSNSSLGTDTNGRIADATSVTVGRTISGNIALDGGQNVGGKDVDFYSFSATAGLAVGFDIDARETGLSSLDSVLRLFDSSGTQIAFNDDNYDPDTNVDSFDSYIEYTFTKSGTYYIAVSGYGNVAYNPLVSGSGIAGSSGAYSLKIRSVGSSVQDLNGTISTAVSLGSAPVSCSAAIGDESSGAADVDFYALTVESNQELNIAIDPGGSGLSGCLRLFNSSGVELAESSGAAPVIDYDFTSAGAGTYYVGVSGASNSSYNPFNDSGAVDGSTGAYTLQVGGSSVHLDFNGTIQRATALGSLPTTVTAAIGDEPVGNMDVDFYSVVITPGQNIGFDIDASEGGASPLHAELRLFNSYGQELAANSGGTDPDTGVTGFDPYLQYTFASGGTYFIAVSGSPDHNYSPFAEASGVPGSTGSYSLTVKEVVNSSDLNGTVATATPVAVPSTTDGSIGDEPAGGLDVDMSSFTAAAGRTLVFATYTPQTSYFDSFLRLFDSGGNELAKNDDSPAGHTLDSFLMYTFSSTGTYYVGVSGYPNDSYEPTAVLSGVSGAQGDYSLTILPDAPDIAPAITKQPSTVQAGKKGQFKQVKITLSNQGLEKATGTATVNLYASTDQTLNPLADTLILSTTVKLKLSPGRSSNVQFSSKALAPDLTPGNYYLIAEVVPSVAIGDANTANNVVGGTQAVQWLGRAGGITLIPPAVPKSLSSVESRTANHPFQRTPIIVSKSKRHTDKAHSLKSELVAGQKAQPVNRVTKGQAHRLTSDAKLFARWYEQTYTGALLPGRETEEV